MLGESELWSHMGRVWLWFNMVQHADALRAFFGPTRTAAISA